MTISSLYGAVVLASFAQDQQFNQDVVLYPNDYLFSTLFGGSGKDVSFSLGDDVLVIKFEHRPQPDCVDVLLLGERDSYFLEAQVPYPVAPYQPEYHDKIVVVGGNDTIYGGGNPFHRNHKDYGPPPKKLGTMSRVGYTVPAYYRHRQLDGRR